MYRKIILLMLGAALAVWLADALVDTFVLHEGPFLAVLMAESKVTRHEFYMLAFLTISIALLGSQLVKFSRKNSDIQEVLKKHSAAVEASLDGIAIYTSDNEYAYANQAYAVLNGYDGPKDLIGKTCRIAYDDKEYARIEQTVMPQLEKSGRWRGELYAKRKNGSSYFQEASITLLGGGERVCIVRDITWRKRNEERLHRSERFLNTIFDSIRDPFCIMDDDFRIIRANEAYAQLKGKPVDALLGRKCYEVLEDYDSVCGGCVVDKTFISADPCAKEKEVTLPDETRVWVEIYTYPILDEEGKVSHVIEYTRDITDRKKSEEEKRKLIEKLEYLSRTDSLTGLLNRRALTDSLTYEIDRAKRYKSELSLILCDIDNFKDINDTLGHDAGDRALQTLSATLKTVLRKSDIAGRYGGDEFMLILPETSIQGAHNLADKLLATLKGAEPAFELSKQDKLSLSIGVAGLGMELDRETSDSLIKRADDGMYASKQGGRNRISIVT